MKGSKYTVKIGQLEWTLNNFKSFDKVKEETKLKIEQFHPLNSSDAGAEAYRERYRDVPIQIRFEGEKEFKTI